MKPELYKALQDGRMAKEERALAGVNSSLARLLYTHCSPFELRVMPVMQSFLNRLYCLQFTKLLFTQPSTQGNSSLSIPNIQQQFKTLIDFHKGKNAMPWHLSIEKSAIPDAGHGVFLKGAPVPAGTLLCLYPGTIYLPWEPLFFQSINNRYVIRLSDASFIDGKRTGLSKWIFKSIRNKHRLGPQFEICDESWLSLSHPFGQGQIINNATLSFQPNVCYHEMALPDGLLSLSDYSLLPNVRYSGDWADKAMRLVCLVSLCDIHENQELYSAYMTKDVLFG